MRGLYSCGYSDIAVEPEGGWIGCVVRSGFPNVIYRVWWGSQVRNYALGDPGPSTAFRRKGPVRPA